jgi:hypothetical protein
MHNNNNNNNNSNNNNNNNNNNNSNNNNIRNERQQVVVCSHVPLHAGATDDSALLWNFEEVLEVLHGPAGRACIVAVLAGEQAVVVVNVVCVRVCVVSVCESE